MANILSADNLVDKAQQVKPSDGIKNASAALTVLIHAVHALLGFRLIEPALDSDGRLPVDATKLTYKHDTSSLTFIITVVPMGGRLLVAGSGLDEQKSHSFDLLVSDYFSQSSFPLEHDKDIKDTFANTNRLVDMVSLYRINILQPLFPGLRKEGYSELSESETRSSSSSVPQSSRGRGYLPDSEGPMGPYGGMPSTSGPSRPQRDPLAVGSRDLDPLGGMTGTFPGFPGSRGPSVGGAPGSEGMLVGTDHPLFRERFGPDSGLATPHGSNDPNRPRWGGDGFLPPGAAPPGARFDPVGPYAGPPGGGGFGGGPGRGMFPPGPGRGPFNGFRPPGSGNVGGPGGSEPDWDGERVPRGDNDYDMMYG